MTSKASGGVSARKGAGERSESLGARRIGQSKQNLIPSTSESTRREFSEKKQRATAKKNLNNFDYQHSIISMLMSNQRPNRFRPDELFDLSGADSFQIFNEAVQPCLRDDSLTEIMDCSDYFFPVASDESLQTMPTSQPAVENPPAYNEVVKVEDTASQPASPPEPQARKPRKVATRRRPAEKLPPRHKSGQYASIKNDAGKIQEDYISDEEERKRVLEKREKNRAAAAKARKRKQEQLETLEKEKVKLEMDINRAREEVLEAQRLRNTLRTIFEEHDRVCAYRQIHLEN
ncbi:Oidioi.mRNA.OKI2018_I69.chr1.g1925.t1.cds [Oikopleura dioica]|uniref:Oidioi.mRNA.OKI2018_I69.chr1.g1925.t1.cds n=1 Tax=Oikopleura dioica TaxID=34765 RepID=A0ABN7SYM0_OIKDI|nr:Oidioi.mRNA.OKI2018_I69.chr1.g1925.t1.cds [Oikopleura dioica]